MSFERMKMSFESLTRFESEEEVKVAKCFQPYVLQPKTEYSWEQSSFMRILNKLREEATRRGFDPKEIKFESARTLDYYDPVVFYIRFGAVKLEFQPGTFGEGLFGFDPEIFANHPEKMQLLLDVVVANHKEACVVFSNPDIVDKIYSGLEAGTSLENIVVKLLEDDEDVACDESSLKAQIFGFLKTQKASVVLTFLTQNDLVNINRWEF